MEIEHRRITQPIKAEANPRKRRATACTRCNARRTKCDASINGLPCSACKSSNNGHTCQFVQSKRTRGPDGRYILPDQQEIQSSSPSTTDEVLRQAEDKQSVVAKTAKEPQINLDLARLCGVDQDSHSGGEDGQDKSNSTNQDENQDEDPQANFIGESWYASYVLSQSAAGHHEMHRPLEGRHRSAANMSGHGYASTISSASAKKPPPSDLPPQHLTEKLLEAYFKRFHMFCPILDRTMFLGSVRDGTVSITLLRSVLFVSVIHCEPEVFHLMGYSTRLDAGDELYSKAVASFDADRESDRTTLVLSSYMLHYWFGKPTHYRDSLFWLGNAIRSAQCMGYHRSTKDSRMLQRDKIQWKRVWWCLYIRDRQVCLSTGAPMIINDLDFDVEELVPEDFDDETPETAQYIIAAATLNRAVSSMYFCYCSPSRLHLSDDPSVRQHARTEIQSTLEEWYNHAQLPADNHHLTLLLKACYHYYIINLQQRLQRLCQKPFADEEGRKITLVAADNVSRLVEDSLLYWTPEHFPMLYVSAIFTAMTVNVGELGISINDREQLSQKLRPNLLALKQFESCYVLAKWVRNLFMEIVNRPVRGMKPGKHGRRLERTQSEGNQIPEEESLNVEDGTQTLTSRSNSSSLPTRETNSEDRQPFNSAAPPISSEPSEGSSYLYSPFIPSNSLPGTDAASSTSAPAMIGFANFLPNLTTYQDEFIPMVQGGVADFPSPTSLEYQSLHFLADLGLSGFNGHGGR